MVTIESHGVTAQLEPERFDDPRFVYAISKLSSERTPEQDKMGYYADMLDMVFGDRTLTVMDELAAANGGALDTDLFNAFFIDVMGQVGAKN